MLLQILDLRVLYFMFLSNFNKDRIIIVLFIYQFVSVYSCGRRGGCYLIIGEEGRKNEENNVYMLIIACKIHKKGELKSRIILGANISVLFKCYIF